MADGIELATEWVTILPETAMLVKKLKEFKPPPISVELEITKKSAQTTAQQASKTVDKTMTTEAKKTGEHVGEALSTGVVKAEPQVKKASDTVGQAIKESVVKKGKEAGEASGQAMADGIAKAKGVVTKAERSVADARRNEANIESRINQIESNIRRYRDQTAAASKKAADLEAQNNQLRAKFSKDAETQIAANERQIAQIQAQNEARSNRIMAAQANQERLQNTRANAASRTANAVDRLGVQEAALAAALASQNAPLEENNKKLRGGGAAAGGMMAGLIPLGRQLLVTTGLFTGALGLGGAITSVLRTGNQFQDSMNKISGITQATGAEMAKINQKARELGRDFTLPATSANDAATAMLELTKAGFTLQQSMDAAKGSLQLAAAAGIDANEAAKITGTTLNAFGLEAKDAGKVTDLLANAANKFPGEMTDFGYSLSQAGAVAKSFGINIEDTTTALGILAQAGIKSSDAGTLIKTMLLSLTDQGKPAQAAIKELGLELYDQAGKFKGIEYVYKRLNQASKEMTEEQYQAATATLFGTDAARFSGLAAGKAAPNWDEMRKAMDRTGTAADVANARLQGLPGAMEKLKNAGQSLSLTIYDAIKKPLEAIVTALAKVVLAFDDWLNSGAIPKFLKEHKEELLGAAAVLGTYVTVLAAIKLATMAWTAAQWLLDAALNANPISLIVIAIAALVAGVIWAYKNVNWFRKAVDTAWSWIKTAFTASLPVLKAVWDAIVVGAKYAWQGLKVAWDAIATAAKWLWNNVMKPVGQYIVNGWKAVWTAVQISFALGKKTFEVIADAAMWLWHNVMEPVWNALKAGWSAVWSGIKFAFEVGKTGFDLVATAALWLWHTIFEPVWEALKSGWSAVWDFLKPIWEGIKGGISAVGDVAKSIASGIKDAWSGVVNVLKAPIHAIGNILAGIPDDFFGVKLTFADDIRNWGKTLQNLAVGGIVKGPGTGTSDSILGIGANGIPTARVSNGEGVVPADVLQTPLGKLLFAMLLGQVPGLASGGLVGQFMSSVSGYKYQIGGFGNGVFDCSGLVSAMVNVAMGRQWNQGPAGGSARTATGGEGAWLESQGFVKGAGGPGTLRVGFYNGGPGGGHTAGTLPDGTNFESNSSQGVVFGSRAAGAADSMFTDKYYLPRGPQVPGASGNPGSISGASFGGGGSGAFSSAGIYGSSGGAGGSVVYDSKKVREAEDRVQDRQRQRDLAQQRLDEFEADRKAGKNVKESTIQNARDQLEKFTRELEESTADLETVRQGEFKKSPKGKRGSGSADDGSGGTDWSEVGKMIFSGFLEGTGLDGSLFSNPFEWPTVKSAMAGLNFLGGFIGGPRNPDGTPATQDSNGGYGQMPGGVDSTGSSLINAGGSMLAGIGDAAGVSTMAPPAANDMVMTGGGSGPTFDMRGSQLGVSPQDFRQEINQMTAANNRYPTLPTN